MSDGGHLPKYLVIQQFLLRRCHFSHRFLSVFTFPKASLFGPEADGGLPTGILFLVPLCVCVGGGSTLGSLKCSQEIHRCTSVFNSKVLWLVVRSQGFPPTRRDYSRGPPEALLLCSGGRYPPRQQRVSVWWPFCPPNR